VEQRLAKIPFVRDVDTYVEQAVPKTVYGVDRTKAALRGVDAARVAETLGFALSGVDAGVLHADSERNPVPIRVELARADRSSEDDLVGLSARNAEGAEVPLGELVQRANTTEGRTQYRKDLRDVQFVLVDAVLALKSDLAERPLALGYEVELAGEGEWQITVDVFRDLGLAFAAALAGIYVLLVAQTGSFAISGLIMLAIPLTLIGIFPGFWLLNWIGAGKVGGFENPIFFTATGMIGMIALAGIVVRNAIILVDFVQKNRATGRAVIESCVEAGAVRLRPILLTAGAAVMGAWVIVFDPIFSGLAWSFVFGVAASTAFTLLVVPIAYALTQGGFRR
jgi:multidrug efflux pump subunit AcrB